MDDLWTDPQIHTADHDGYGDGNLGLGGMALFFHSHVCNSICESLGLSKFDLAPSEIKQQNNRVTTVFWRLSYLQSYLEAFKKAALRFGLISFVKQPLIITDYMTGR